MKQLLIISCYSKFFRLFFSSSNFAPQLELLWFFCCSNFTDHRIKNDCLKQTTVFVKIFCHPKFCSMFLSSSNLPPQIDPLDFWMLKLYCSSQTNPTETLSTHHSLKTFISKIWSRLLWIHFEEFPLSVQKGLN